MAPYALWVAPRLSVGLLSIVSKNPAIKKFRSRPAMVRRAGKSLATGGVLISQLNVTNACNQRCPMCNLWKESGRMPLEQVKLAIDRIADLGSFMLTITGGEPFAHPDIGAIIDYAYEKQFFLNINTDGSVPIGRYRAADLNKVDVAIVSFHAMDEDKLERITGVRGTLPKVLETLRYFRDHSSLRIILKFVIQSANEGEAEKVQEFADREGFTVEYHPVMVGSGNRPVATDDRVLLPSDEGLLRTLLWIQERKRAGRTFESSAYYPFCIDAIRKKSLRWGCDAGLSYLSVSPDGRFGICKDVYTSAKITDGDFLERYRRPDFREEMRRLREGCEGCNWSCYITASKMAHLIRDPDARELALLKSF